VNAVKVDNGRATVTATKDGQELKFDADKVLVSVVVVRSRWFGARRKSAWRSMKRNGSKVDEHFRTNVEGV